MSNSFQNRQKKQNLDKVLYVEIEPLVEILYAGKKKKNHCKITSILAPLRIQKKGVWCSAVLYCFYRFRLNLVNGEVTVIYLGICMINHCIRKTILSENGLSAYTYYIVITRSIYILYFKIYLYYLLLKYIM